MQVRIAPCWFCGSAMELVPYAGETYRLYCKKCKLTGASGISKRKCVEYWNRINRGAA